MYYRFPKDFIFSVEESEALDIGLEDMLRNKDCEEDSKKKKCQCVYDSQEKAILMEADEEYVEESIKKSY